VTDLAGATATRTIAINVVGANDTPVATGAYSHTVTDTALADTYSVLTGSLSASDRDTSDSLVWSGSTTGTFGSLLVNSNGSYSFTPNVTAINAVQAGSTPSDTFTVTVTDLAGATATRTIAINVVGANDTPVASGTYIHSIADTPAADNFAALTGTLIATDRDALDTLTWSGSRVGSFGALTVNSNGSYSYAVDSGAVDALEAGATAVDTFVATVTDALGATATRTITVNFTGIDDVPYMVAGNDHLMQGTRDSDTLSGSDLPTAEMSTFIGGGGNDSLNFMTAGQAFAGGDGFDSVKFNVHSIAVADITGARSHFEINMLPDSRATNPGVISDEFTSAIDASSASSKDFGFIQIFNQDHASAYLQAEKISVEYDNGTVNNFSVSKDATTGRGLLTLSSADDRILAITADQIDGGAGNDVIYAYGNASEANSLFAPASISGGAGNDILAAGTPGVGVYNPLDEAVLNGGDGNDVLVAVSGKVTAIGGAGRDVFALNSSSQHVDLFINNFNATDDAIDLSAFSALHSGITPTPALSTILQSALSAAPSHGGQIELDLSAFSSAGHAKVTINSLETSAPLTISNFVFSEQTWSPTNWHDNLNPLVNS
jgi:VCBS repeat-containing protein